MFWVQFVSMFQALILHFFPLITFFFPHGFLGHIIPRHMTRERAGHAVRSNHILDRSQAPISLSASLMRSTYVDCYDRLPVFPGLFLFLPRSAHKYRTCSRMERRMQIYPQESLNVFSPRFCLRPVWPEEPSPRRVIWYSRPKILKYHGYSAAEPAAIEVTREFVVVFNAPVL